MITKELIWRLRTNTDAAFLKANNVSHNTMNKMDRKEQFEKWRNQTIEQLSEIEKKRNILYKKFCKEFDSQVLTLLFQVETSFKQLTEVYDNGCKMFEIESEYDN